METPAAGPATRSQPRPTWSELPGDVRAGVEHMLGAAVVGAESVPLGLTPGLASRVELADGRRAFLKAAGVHRSASAVEKLRREARVMAALPPEAPTPRLLGCYDDGRWAAVASTDVAGRPPSVPWTSAELERVLAAVADCAAATTPAPFPGPRFVTDWAADLTGWRELARRHFAATGAGSRSAADGAGSRSAASGAGSRSAADDLRAVLPADLSDRVIDDLDRLARLEAGWSVRADGDTLLHGDLRADNILLTGERVWFVDWPSASVGAAWLDLLFLLPGIAAATPGFDPQEVVLTHPLTRDVDPATLTAMLTAIAGFLATVSLEPPPWYAPEVRSFQRAEAAAAVCWLYRRLPRS